MTNLLIDTCVWLDIAKSSKGENLLHLLEQLINEDKIELIIPEIVITEFERNKERTIASAKKSLSAVTNTHLTLPTIITVELYVVACTLTKTGVSN